MADKQFHCTSSVGGKPVETTVMAGNNSQAQQKAKKQFNTSMSFVCKPV
jgi:hypothetical protein